MTEAASRLLGITVEAFQEILIGSDVKALAGHEETLARVILYVTSDGDPCGPCYYGLVCNLREAVANSSFAPTFKLIDHVRYVYDHALDGAHNHDCDRVHRKASLLEEGRPPGVLLDLRYFKQDHLRGFHRGGWSRVHAGLAELDYRNVHPARRYGPVIKVDVFLDRTFGWAKDTLALMGQVPYRDPWLGVLHHTFYTAGQRNNDTAALLACEEFQASLATCRGIVVLSEYMARQLRARLQGTSIFAIPHPMDEPASRFTWQAFLKGSRRIVQVGGWLRESYGIFRLQLPHRNPLGLRKCALRGRDMNNYFQPDGLLDVLAEKALASHGENMHCRGMLEMLREYAESVEVLETLDDEAYDELLASSLVFLKLLDASAVNTVLECLARDTPVVVNRHPALEEVLGEDYPLFYEDYAHAQVLLADEQRVHAAHRHLASADKSRFTLQSFLDTFQEIATSTL